MWKKERGDQSVAAGVTDGVAVALNFPDVCVRCGVCDECVRQK